MQIKESLDDLIESIEKSDIYLNYKHILNQVENNEDIKILVNDIKSIQKELVNEEHLNNSSNIDDLEDVLKSKKENLNSIPLYKEYIDASNLLNNLIQSVSIKIQTYINDLDI